MLIEIISITVKNVKLIITIINQNIKEHIIIVEVSSIKFKKTIKFIIIKMY
jgi:hypothetical protein